MSIKFDSEAERRLRKDASDMLMPISMLVRQIVRRHYRLTGKKSRRPDAR